MRKISLRTVLVTMMVVVALTSTLMFNAVYGNLASQAFSQMDLQLVTKNLEQTKENLDEVFLSAQKLCDYIQSSILPAGAITPEGFESTLRPLVQIDNAISSVILYDISGVPVCGAGGQGELLKGRDLGREPWFTQTLSGTETVYSGARLEHEFRGSYTWVVTMARMVSYTMEDVAYSGLLTVNLRLSKLKEICDSGITGAGGYFALTDEQGATVYSPRAKLESMKALSQVFQTSVTRPEDAKKLVLSQALQNGQYVLVGNWTEDSLGTGNADLRSKSTLVLALALLIAVVMATFLAEAVVRPFRSMEHAMDRIDGGVSGVRLRIQGFKEFARMSAKYNIMIDKIDKYTRELVENQEQIRDMEVASLQDQINPHFLYNALDSITWLVETGKNKDAVRTIEALAKLLRLSINRGGNYHSVARELEHIENYLIIQKTRYGQRFTSSIEVQTDAKELYCPRLILQPIVENAIKHGMGENEDCHIKIDVFLKEDCLYATIWDDGMGLLPAKLGEVQRALRETQPPRPEEINGLALKSVNRRIRLLCGEKYGITIDSEMEEWTCVTIKLPVQRSV